MSINSSELWIGLYKIEEAINSPLVAMGNYTDFLDNYCLGEPQNGYERCIVLFSGQDYACYADLQCHLKDNYGFVCKGAEFCQLFYLFVESLCPSICCIVSVT